MGVGSIIVTTGFDYYDPGEASEGWSVLVDDHTTYERTYTLAAGGTSALGEIPTKTDEDTLEGQDVQALMHLFDRLASTSTMIP